MKTCLGWYLISAFFQREAKIFRKCTSDWFQQTSDENRYAFVCNHSIELLPLATVVDFIFFCWTSQTKAARDWYKLFISIANKLRFKAWIAFYDDALTKARIAFIFTSWAYKYLSHLDKANNLFFGVYECERYFCEWMRLNAEMYIYLSTDSSTQLRVNLKWKLLGFLAEWFKVEFLYYIWGEVWVGMEEAFLQCWLGITLVLRRALRSSPMELCWAARLIEFLAVLIIQLNVVCMMLKSFTENDCRNESSFLKL